MVDKLKTYFVQVLVNKVSPQVAGTLIAYLVAFLGTHAELMEKLGITYYPSFSGVWDGAAPTGPLITIELDTLHVYGGALLAAGLVALWALIQHHGTSVVTGTPQSGDVRACQHSADRRNAIAEHSRRRDAV